MIVNIFKLKINVIQRKKNSTCIIFYSLRTHATRFPIFGYSVDNLDENSTLNYINY